MAKRERGIRISPKHGLNPTLMQCFLCGEAAGVALLGRLKGDVEAPRQAIFDKTPCAKCQDFMKKGIILISVDEKKSVDHANPWRSGGWCVVKEDALTRIINDTDMIESVKKARVAFLSDSAWDQIGLPRHNVPEAAS